MPLFRTKRAILRPPAHGWTNTLPRPLSGLKSPKKGLKTHAVRFAYVRRPPGMPPAAFQGLSLAVQGLAMGWRSSAWLAGLPGAFLARLGPCVAGQPPAMAARIAGRGSLAGQGWRDRSAPPSGDPSQAPVRPRHPHPHPKNKKSLTYSRIIDKIQIVKKRRQTR